MKILRIVALLVFLLMQDGYAATKLSRQLLHNTVRIEAFNASSSSVGTGFFFSFDQTNSFTPLIVSCWHVVSGYDAARFSLALGTNGTRTGEQVTIVLPALRNLWIRHPDTNIDLAVMPMASLLMALDAQGKQLDWIRIQEQLIPNASELSDLSVFHEVKFVGYPIGIWDSKNNLPIIRRGMMASDPGIDYEGRPEFLIDASVFPGSSGSPVFIADEAASQFSPGFAFGDASRLRFLGILYAVHQYSFDGKIEFKTIPTALDATSHQRIPANLGLVIKSEQLRAFLPLLDKLSPPPVPTPTGTNSIGTNAPAPKVAP